MRASDTLGVAVTEKAYPLTRKPQMTRRAPALLRVTYPTVRPDCDGVWIESILYS